MGVSILIPVYNTHIQHLVEKLHSQAIALDLPFEIIIADDCSELSISYINMKVRQLENVNYIVLTENIGRAKNRNLLFETAKYDKCIIMDGDVDLPDNNFLSKYLNALKPDNVVVGGHSYSPLPPIDSKLYLHWLYGSKIESSPLENRKNHPYESFKTVCFAIHKSTFQKIRFDENIEGYGHEDTIFGIDLKKAGVKIEHIQNPVIHLGLDEADTFLQKQKQAVKNLKKLYFGSNLKKELESSIRLVKWGKLPIPVKILKLFEQSFLKNLKKPSPRLFFLQIQKLIWLKE